MKLVDILARELSEWPNCDFVQQGVDAVTREQWQAARDALGWNGEGLPPVGLECERVWAGTAGSQFDRVKVLAHDGSAVVFRVLESGTLAEDTQGPVTGKGGPLRFRPIRTAEQLAAAERSKACDLIFRILSNVERPGNRSDMAEALYDAGYRLVEVQP